MIISYLQQITLLQHLLYFIYQQNIRQMNQTTISNQNNENDIQEDDQYVEFESKAPQQVIISLKQQKNIQLSYSHNNQLLNTAKLSKVSIKTLNDRLRDKIQQSSELKQTIQSQKATIKQLGIIVDNKINRAIFRQNRTSHSIKLKQIFHQGQQTNNQKIKNINQQLNILRKQTQKQKQETQKAQRTINDPIKVGQIQAAGDLLSRLKQKDQLLKQAKEQKCFLVEQNQKLRQMIPIEGQNELQQQRKLKEDYNNTVALIKQQKNKIYDIEKVDCMITEKIIYLKEIIQHMDAKNKPKPYVMTPILKEEIASNIKQLSHQIRQLIDEKNTIQIQKLNQLKNLLNQHTILEKKNWEKLRQLRQIDSFLLKYYAAKLRNPKISRLKRMNQTKIEQKSAIYAIQTSQKYKTLDQINKQQNISQLVLIQKRKIIQLGMLSSNHQDIVINDQFMGYKQKISQVCIFCDQNKIYGIRCDYKNQFNGLQRGFNMISRIKPKQVKEMSLSINIDQQYLSLIKISLNENKQIAYLKLEASSGKQLEWGQQNGQKDQKIIKKYQSIFLRSKLCQIGQESGLNAYCLGGIGFLVAYLTKK